MPRLEACTATVVAGPDGPARLVRANPKVSVALEDGNAPVTGEGTAAVRDVAEVPAAVRQAFVSTYEWDIGEDLGYVVIEIAVTKWLSPGETVVA